MHVPKGTVHTWRNVGSGIGKLVMTSRRVRYAVDVLLGEDTPLQIPLL